jgi:hypothetical protein
MQTIKEKITKKIDKAKCRELFWKPVEEMANVIINNIHNGDAELYDVVDDLDTHIDSSIFGKRVDHPVFRRTLLMVIKKEFSELLGEMI